MNMKGALKMKTKTLHVGSAHNGELWIFKGLDPETVCEIIRIQLSPPKKVEGPFNYLQDAEDRLLELLEEK